MYCCDTMLELVDAEMVVLEIESDQDAVMIYKEVYDEYGLIIRDGGSSYISIDFCPWCGKRRISKREQWFRELEEMGYHQPFEEDIPEQYKSSDWWKSKL